MVKYRAPRKYSPAEYDRAIENIMTGTRATLVLNSIGKKLHSRMRTSARQTFINPTGFTARWIDHGPVRKDPENPRNGLVTYVGIHKRAPGVAGGKFVEWGTVNSPPRPWIRGALR